MQVLIDGHNLIGQMKSINLADANDEHSLINRLKQYRARTGRKLVVIFDAGSGLGLGTQSQRGGITVQYAPKGRTADQLLIKRLREARNPAQMMLVSSDREVQRAARDVRARTMSSQAFAAELENPPQHARKRRRGGTRRPKTEPALSRKEVDEWLAIFNEKSNTD